MAEGKSGIGGIAEGVSSIFNQLGQFFHIFDLSFFASGAATFGAFAFACASFKPELPTDLQPWAWVTIFVLGSYISGVASFSVGRKFRNCSEWRRSLHVKLRTFLKSHGMLDDEIISSYLDDELDAAEQNRQAFRLYSRLWAELRDNYGNSESFRVLNRYWVTSAMYDGLIVSFLVWAGVLLIIAVNDLFAARWLAAGLLTVTALLFGLLSRACYQEGDRNFQYQVSELVATFAALKRRILPDSPWRRRAPISS